MKNNVLRFRILQKINWVKLSVIILAMLMGFLVWNTPKYIEKSTFCYLCHSMQPWYNSWHNSSHHEIQCTLCHNVYPTSVPKSATITVKKYQLTTNKVVKVFGKSIDYLIENIPVAVVYCKNKATILLMYYNMFRGKANSPWKNCIKCHQDLIASADRDHFGHFKHMENGLTGCKQCHDGLVHGKPAKTSWMTCALCHSTPPKPASHNSIDFETTHGQDYMNHQTCALCHPGGINQKLCFDCHKTTLPHLPNYKTKHIQEIAKVGITNCMNCHQQQPGANQPASTACESCHGKKMPHDKNILQTHPSLAKEEGVKICSYCHQSTPDQKDMAPSCISCHRVEMPHPQNWRSIHPSTVYAIGKEVCIFCHSPSNPINPGGPESNPNFCWNCHEKVVMHPQNWRDDHYMGSVKIPTRCFICHPDKQQNHCLTCHYDD